MGSFYRGRLKTMDAMQAVLTDPRHRFDGDMPVMENGRHLGLDQQFRRKILRQRELL
jgi:hypothetical protein